IGYSIPRGANWSREWQTTMRAELSAAPGHNDKILSKPSLRADTETIGLLILLSAVAVLIHGYHSFIEDAEIYVPGIKKLLNPALYPFNEGFFASHAGLTLFPNLIAWSVRLTHLPLEWALLLWHFVCIFLLLLACWKLGQICF